MNRKFGQYTLDTIERSGYGIGAYFGNIQFANGYGASVVRTEFSYGGENGLYEIAVLNPSGELDFDTEVADDVVGWLSKPDVEKYLKLIENIGGEKLYNSIDMLIALGAKNITTERQFNNGTVVFEIPITKPSINRGYSVTVASYKSGYVRRLNTYSSPYQLNPTKRSLDLSYGGTKVKRILIPNPIDRLDYIVDYVIRNYK